MSDSFASVMNAFGKLTEIEQKIDIGIERSKVPNVETRKFLRGMDASQLSSSPLLQYMEDLMYEMGLGSINLKEMSAFRYIFSTEDSDIYLLFPGVTDKAVCTPSVEALARFFTEDMGLKCNVKEIACKNMGSDSCDFVVELEPLSVYQKVLDENDVKILTSADEGAVKVEKAASATGMESEDLNFKFEVLRYYQIIKEDLTLTDAGSAYSHFIKSHPPQEDMEDFDPPWRSMEKLSSAIAATKSFAEAMVEITEDEELPWKQDDATLLEAKEKAADKKGFAELMNEFSKGMDDEEE